jgi:hypothetical protein
VNFIEIVPIVEGASKQLVKVITSLKSLLLRRPKLFWWCRTGSLRLEDRCRFRAGSLILRAETNNHPIDSPGLAALWSH